MKNNTNNFLPDLNKSHNNLLIKRWLLLAISALAAAGLYSLPPVILRGSFFADKFDIEHVFATALVVHVDLSVLVWFLSIGGLFWSLLARKEQMWLYKTAFYVTAFGMILITISPFIGDSNPIKNNYVPMLSNFTFIVGLSIFASGILFQTILTLVNFKEAKKSPINIAVYISALITLIASVCFIISARVIEAPTQDNLLHYYEELFWGGGHVLQFTFTTLMLIAWLVLSGICNKKQLLPTKAILALLGINLLIALPSPLFFLSEESRYLFSEQMKYGLGLAAIIIGASIIIAPSGKNILHHSIKASLILSIILFGYGGFLGYMISGVNVTIPAHYHGSIVAVTLSFIGLSYYLLPNIGFGEVKGKLATIQPYVYGIGQIMHVTGLAWMGGYGALRKAAGSAASTHTLGGKILFFSGGALAIIGGLLFIIVAFRAIAATKKKLQ